MGRAAASYAWRSTVLSIVLLSCDGSDPSSPETPAKSPSRDAGPVLAEGTYDVTFTACGACDPAVVPDYLFVLSHGIEGVVRITDADEYGAVMQLVEMRQARDGTESVLDLFGSPVIVLRWSEEEDAHRGSVPFGAAAEFQPSLRPARTGVDCDFTVFHLKHDVGSTACTANPRD